MYGIINKAIKDLVVTNFGDEAWSEILEKLHNPNDEFTNLETYDDSLTYDLVGAASEVLNVRPDEVLYLFGKHWIIYTKKNGYGALMDMFGHSFIESLKNLNQLHMRMGYSMPNMKAPSFKVIENDDSSIDLEYHSSRQGLSSMVIGLLDGMAAKFDEAIEIEHVAKSAEQNFDLFKISIKSSICTSQQVKQT